MLAGARAVRRIDQQMLLRLGITCYMPVLVTCDGEIVGVITPEWDRQFVDVPCEMGQQVLLHSDMPYLLYSAEESEEL